MAGSQGAVKTLKVGAILSAAVLVAWRLLELFANLTTVGFVDPEMLPFRSTDQKEVLEADQKVDSTAFDTTPVPTVSGSTLLPDSKSNSERLSISPRVSKGQDPNSETMLDVEGNGFQMVDRSIDLPRDEVHPNESNLSQEFQLDDDTSPEAGGFDPKKVPDDPPLLTNSSIFRGSAQKIDLNGNWVTYSKRDPVEVRISGIDVEWIVTQPFGKKISYKGKVISYEYKTVTFSVEKGDQTLKETRMIVRNNRKITPDDDNILFRK